MEVIEYRSFDYSYVKTVYVYRRDKDDYIQDPGTGLMHGRKSKSSAEVDNSGGSGIIKIDDIEIGKSLSAKAKNYNIKELSTGNVYHFAEGTKIQNAQVFAGKGCKKPLEPEVSDGLARQIGGEAQNWQHCKGDGIIDYFGEERKAEVHWFQEKSVGKHKFKIKRWIDED